MKHPQQLPLQATTSIYNFTTRVAFVIVKLNSFSINPKSFNLETESINCFLFLLDLYWKHKIDLRIVSPEVFFLTHIRVIN